MTEHNLFYYPYASFTNIRLPLLKVAVVYFDKLIILDPGGASWATIDADYYDRDAVVQLKDAEILAKFAGPRLCVHHGHSRRRMAAGLAQRPKNRASDWSALPIESVS